MKKASLILVLLAGLVAIMPIAAQDETNLVDECVVDFDPTVDYFPNKVDITNAQNFSVMYFNNYKVVTVAGSMRMYDYVLVQCGTPTPDADDFPEGTQFIEVPAGNMISLSTTFLPGMAELGLAENVVGLDSLLYTSTPEILERIDNGDIIAVSPNFELNLELVLETEPDLVISDDYNPGRFTQLTDNDIFTAISTDYLEATPLGRAEWLKYTALFYNAEAEAEAMFTDIVTAYDEARELASTVTEENRPVVLWNAFSTYDSVWSIPGPETYAGMLIEDAGGVIALGDEAEGDSTLLSIETVYDSALDADIWIINQFAVSTPGDLIAQDARYIDFSAITNGNVWNNDLDVNENGGNNFFELGVLSPHLILQDLVAIFHPDLLPDHEFTFYRQLDAAGQ